MSIHVFPTSVVAPPPAARRLVRTLRGSLHAQQAAASIQEADTALGCPDPAVDRPSVYFELAEQAIGQLDPCLRPVAERAGAAVLLAGIDVIERAGPDHRESAALAVFRSAVEVYRRRLQGNRQ